VTTKDIFTICQYLNDFCFLFFTKESDAMKLDLLTNATVVDESIKFVEEKSRDERCIIKKEAAVGLTAINPE